MAFSFNQSASVLTNGTSLVNSTAQQQNNEMNFLSLFTVFLCGLILCSGVIGNALVIIVFGSKCSHLKTFEVYMMNLAVADIITTAIYPSKYLHRGLGGSFGSIGHIGCGVMEYLATTSTVVSSYTLVIISIDR